MVSRRLILALVISGATVILATAVGAWGGLDAAAQSGQVLEGSWLGEGTSSTQGPFPVAGGVAGARVSTYNADGTFVTTSLGRGVIPTTAQGTWIRTGDREFATTSVGFGRDAEGNYTATVKVRTRIQVNERGDETSSRSQVEVFDRNGNVVATDSTTGQGKRIRVEPLN